MLKNITFEVYLEGVKINKGDFYIFL